MKLKMEFYSIIHALKKTCEKIMSDEVIYDDTLITGNMLRGKIPNVIILIETGKLSICLLIMTSLINVFSISILEVSEGSIIINWYFFSFSNMSLFVKHCCNLVDSILRSWLGAKPETRARARFGQDYTRARLFSNLSGDINRKCFLFIW